MQDQLDEGDYKVHGQTEQALLDKLDKNLTTQLRILDIDLGNKEKKIQVLILHPSSCKFVPSHQSTQSFPNRQSNLQNMQNANENISTEKNTQISYHPPR